MRHFFVWKKCEKTNTGQGETNKMIFFVYEKYTIDARALNFLQMGHQKSSTALCSPTHVAMCILFLLRAHSIHMDTRLHTSRDVRRA